MSILPHQLPALAGYDFGARIVPMSAVGGDFYDFIPLEGGRLGIIVGDVSGHGVPAALFMAMVVTMLRAEACRTCSPREVLHSRESPLAPHERRRHVCDGAVRRARRDGAPVYLCASRA